MRARLPLVLLVALLGVLVAAPSADAIRQTRKKAIWGPVKIRGKSQFPIYHDLGVGVFQYQLTWGQIAGSRPANPADPNDPAYRWPADLDYAIREAKRYRMRISVMIMGIPGWANGNQSWRTVPGDPTNFATFAGAAARRYPTIHLWQIWGEASGRHNFRPMANVPNRLTLTAAQAEAPQRYARYVDASYGALKRVSRENLVIGGCTFTSGQINPFAWARYMRLPNGRPPRMDLYAHNPFSTRTPNMRNGPSTPYTVDFSDLGRYARWIDRWVGRRADGRQIPLFLSEFTVPTAPDRRFNIYTTRANQAKWVAAAIGISRGWSRIYTFGYIDVRDVPAKGVTSGLIDARGRKKPAYFAYRRG